MMAKSTMKPMTRPQVRAAQDRGGLNAAQRAADNRQDAKVRAEKHVPAKPADMKAIGRAGAK